MYVNCENIKDFCTMITTCCSNGIKDIRVFISEKESFPSIAFENTSKDNISFTYVLFTPLYTAIYKGNVKEYLYKGIINALKECQEKCNHDFRIQVFDSMSFDYENGCLSINNESEVL